MPPVEPSVAVLGEPGALEPADDGRRFFPRRVLYLQHSRPGARLESSNRNAAYNRGGTDISGVPKAPPPPCACPEAGARASIAVHLRKHGGDRRRQKAKNDPGPNQT